MRILDTSTVPQEVSDRFIRRGSKYHLPDGTYVFTDRGKRLVAATENTEVIASLIYIAQSRGWTHITVTGSERFKREAWGAAQLAGLQVRGHQATEQEQALVVRRIARQRTEEGAPAPKQLEKQHDPDSNLWAGRLIDHGPAPYRHDPKQAMSYFVRIETSAGESELWGVDFERALKESASKPRMGDEVTLRSLGQKPVTVSVPTRDADGRVSGERKLRTHRNRWVVEKTSFLHERAAVASVIRDPEVAPARAVKTHPSLVGTYLAIHAAELASRQFRDPKDQARFVEIVRNGLADSIERGEPLQAVRLRERAPTLGDTPTRTPARDRTPGPWSITMSERQIGQLVAGRLQEHGRAHYRFQSHQDLSYFVRLLTSDGQHTVWGKDLDRAVHTASTRPQIGDLIGVRLTAREPVTRTEPLHARNGKLLARVEHRSYRNVWQIEKIQYFGQRATMARRIRDAQADVRQTLQTRPELKSSYLSIRAAQAFADQRITDPKDRERFVELVRGAIAGSIRDGQPLPEMRIKDTAHTPAPTAARGILSLRPQERSDERAR